VESTLASATAERIYVADFAINNIIDGRLRIFDATSGKVLGQLHTGYAGMFTLGAKADEVYIATSYMSRGTRGERSEVLEVWDSNTLKLKYEVLLPPRRAQALNYRGLLTLSGNGRFAFVQNATPATSITVVDLKERKVATEVATPGCWGTLPAASHPARIAMLCGDGKIATISFDDNGQVADRQVTDKLFDADQDAWFLHAERSADRYWFVSFKGMLHEVDVGGGKAELKSSKNMVDADSAKQGWRPGGYQLFAVHPNGRWAVVAMHDKGSEGTHKLPAKRLWFVDVASGKRMGSMPGFGTASITFSRNGQRLQALDGTTGAMRVWRWADGKPMKLLTTVSPAGAAALQLESHD